jgi:hypothetical protein
MSGTSAKRANFHRSKAKPDSTAFERCYRVRIDNEFEKRHMNGVEPRVFVQVLQGSEGPWAKRRG